jgi:TPR repeat protein
MLYRRACTRRHALACYRLADLYEKGAGVGRDPERAAALIRRSCEYGYTEACTPARSS